MRSLDSVQDKNRRQQLLLDMGKKDNRDAKILRGYEIQLEKLDNLLISLKERAKMGIEGMLTQEEIENFKRDYIQQKIKKIGDTNGVEFDQDIKANYSINNLIPTPSMYFKLFMLYALFFSYVWFAWWVRRTLNSDF